MSFTPAPWSVQNKGNLYGKSARCEVVSGIVDTSNPDHVPHQPTIAKMKDLSSESYDNASLIAAAPDMYEALEAWNTYLSMGYPDNLRQKAIAVEKTDKALAKAKGERGNKMKEDKGSCYDDLFDDPTLGKTEEVK